VIQFHQRVGEKEKGEIEYGARAKSVRTKKNFIERVEIEDNFFITEQPGSVSVK